MYALVVEDEEMVSDVLNTLLSADAFDVTVARDIASANALSCQRQPDLLVCDLHLPDGVGVDLCRKVADDFPECKIILMTGSNDFTDTVELSMKKGLNGPVLQKPFSLTKFRGIVRCLFEHSGHAPANLVARPQEQPAL
jgi:DNA-binding response OmpR family regulator